MEYTTKTSEKTGKTRVYVGKTSSVYNKQTRAYEELEEMGFAIVGYKTVTDKNGVLVPAISLAVSNIYFLAVKSTKGGVHYALNEKNLSRFTKATRTFKVDRANADFDIAKKYLLDAFGTQITWEEFERICEEAGLKAEAEARAKAEAEKAARKARDAKTKEILAHIAM